MVVLAFAVVTFALVISLMAGDDSTPARPTLGTLRRFAKATRFVEGLSRPASGLGSNQVAYMMGPVRAVVTEEISSGSFNGLGYGKARPCHKTISGEWKFYPEVDVANQYGGDPVEVNTAIFIVPCSGEWFALTGACSPESTPIITEGGGD